MSLIVDQVAMITKALGVEVCCFIFSLSQFRSWDSDVNDIQRWLREADASKRCAGLSDLVSPQLIKHCQSSSLAYPARQEEHCHWGADANGVVFSEVGPDPNQDPLEILAADSLSAMAISKHGGVP